MDLDKLQELIRIFERSDLSEIEVEEEGRRVRLRKPTMETVVQQPVHVSPVERFAAPTLTVEQKAGPAMPPDEEKDDSLATINSPMVGVFYEAPAPGEPPFVRPGDTIAVDKTLCIVEAMKLMNEVTAKFPGEIVDILVENGEPVEYDQPLFTIRPLE
ncbi:MAG: acetyl-CoA carboxylase biotin carboxyl carrier protein [bacterium]|nr:acetyl-CoA carboxylase biotin carboxyl carrier protein [bacterium]